MSPALTLPEVDNHRNIIIADGDRAKCESLKEFFISEGYGVYICQSVTDFMTVEHNDLCAIILDLSLEYGESIQSIELVKQSRVGEDIPILISSDMASTNDIIRALNAGATDYILKPYTNREIFQRLVALIKK